MPRPLKIVGISGLPRSGKDTLAEMFVASGYFGVSFGDIVREFARKRHAGKPDPISVANLTDTSNWLREQHGADVILKEALERFEKAKKQKEYKGVVLFSVRAPVEADFILERGGELIWVEASDQIRYERAMQYLREGEAKITLEEFKRQEGLQWLPQAGIPPEVQMNIAYVKQKATKIFDNSVNDADAFRSKSKKLIKEIAA